MVEPVVYSSDVDDNRRWSRIDLRPCDIVVSTRSKHGTTWVQQLCAMLVFGSPELPEPLGTLSPWVDWRVEPIEDLAARLARQRHRRVLKTHTPLDGLPLEPTVTYIVVARHPLDAAVSLYHQGANLDRGRIAELIGEEPPGPEAARPPLPAWLRAWAADTSTPAQWLDSPAGVLHHVADAWARRDDATARAGATGLGPQRIVLVHYADLLADLPGEVRRLADALGTPPPQSSWEDLVDAAKFASMRRRAAASVPDHAGVLRSPTSFFRSGRSGEGRALLSEEEVAAFEDRCRALAPAEVVDWLLR